MDDNFKRPSGRTSRSIINQEFDPDNISPTFSLTKFDMVHNQNRTFTLKEMNTFKKQQTNFKYLEHD